MTMYYYKGFSLNMPKDGVEGCFQFRVKRQVSLYLFFLPFQFIHSPMLTGIKIGYLI